MSEEHLRQRLREAGFNVKVSSIDSGNVGRPAVSYSIPRRRVTV